MRKRTSPVLQVAVPAPLRRHFDYLAPPNVSEQQLTPGVRIKVPFGGRTHVGVLLATSDDSSVPAGRLKRAMALLDTTPVLPDDMLQLMTWASTYYQHPVGEVLQHALPVLLRQGRSASAPTVTVWRLAAGSTLDPDTMAQLHQRAPRQAALLESLQQAPDGLNAAQFSDLQWDWRAAMARLVDKGQVEAHTRSCLSEPGAAAAQPGPPLNDHQQAAVAAATGHLGEFEVCLLDGVTGSGKTEVYLNIIEQVIAQDRQALVLVPEIGLTPQLVARFRKRLASPPAVLHSGLTDQERLCAWLAARDGEASVVIGTRSAVFTPLARPGVFIVDEEHDVSFKQQEGFRYSARDLAIVRARRTGIPVVLGSATPSLESLHNAARARYRHLILPERAGAARPPALHVLDVRHRPMAGGISAPLLEAMQRHLTQAGQVLLFLNRRGYAPTLICHDCGWVGSCHSCVTHMTFHQGERRLRCHHCGAERKVDVQCPDCGSPDLRSLGVGTEQIEQSVREQLPDFVIVRIDRDSTRRKGAMDRLLTQVHEGHGQILVGTQMIAKGHHFPNVTLVGVLDADQGLYSADFRASERMAQLILQVAGRAGRAERPGEVLIQTHHPDHPLLQALINDGYHAFAEALLAEREETSFPPCSHLALLRAEAPGREAPLVFLEAARESAEALAADGVSLFGPLTAPMERRAGRYRAQLLLQSDQRAALHRLLARWAPALEALKSGRRVRWSLDVDPMEMF
ncbi:MAG: primosomal protein N' [Pseudomonadota bacterium]|nr:MAG: primosomal protein N' [Pseudomonadota bacterium]